MSANGGRSPFIQSVRGPGHEVDRPCRRGCCWTPLGHSTVRDIYPKTDKRACRCHDTEGEAA